MDVLSKSIQAQPIPGKGNGFVCIDQSGIEEGTLLLRETVFEGWGASYAPPTAAANLIYRSKKDATVKSRLAHLFPFELSQLSQSDIDRIPATSIDLTRFILKSLDHTDNTPDSIILRHIFVIECNSFPSGLLLTLSYANHSCEPNAKVFEEEGINGDHPIYSLWTTRDIQPGEEILISYIDMETQIHEHEARKRKLESKFCFTCGCGVCLCEVPRIGALEGVPEAVLGPRGEDFSCCAFDGESKQCTGRVRKLTRVCEDCGALYSEPEIGKVEIQWKSLMGVLQKRLGEANSFMKAVKVKPEVDVIPDLKRLKVGVENANEQARGLLHPSHLAFVPMTTCMDKLGSLIRREERRGRVLACGNM
ncbi:UNVERIFIED_CONTAM: hypothetical protein HDU68_009428 [Siphonaria sp. JEL0065]|nr:hypothetical protein HDU68_009428 [Siphonaria sp. JEL0065]